ncbi:MAG: dienelactone hydrolase family protein [Thermoplasmata archaeon]|nr:dienelactone hydrolase family protein [Thermoplasmata archaeon]
MPAPSRTVALPTPHGTMDCFLAFPPDSSTPRPAVVVIHEIFGADAHIRNVAERFAAEGYVAAAPELFPREVRAVLTPANIALAMQSLAQAPPELRKDPGKFAEFAATQPPERRPVLEAFGTVTNPSVQAGFAEDLLALTTYLRSLPEVDPRRVGSVGFCFGGAMSARLATLDPELRAAVVFYGQNPPIDDVPRIRASVLGLYGELDPGLTGTVPLFAEAMARSGRSFSSQVYPGAKHAFFNDTRPSNYHAESAADAWRRTLQFLSASFDPDGLP